MVLCIVTGAIGLAGCIAALGHVLWSTSDRQLRRRRAPKQSAARQVDELFAQARIHMEEAAGYRRPGERRIEDGFGSWRSW